MNIQQPVHAADNHGLFFVDDQVTLAVKGPDVFLFKIRLNALVLQLADGGQAVDCVSGKAADGLGDDEIYFPVEGIVHHVLEALALAGIAAGLSFV